MLLASSVVAAAETKPAYLLKISFSKSSLSAIYTQYMKKKLNKIKLRKRVSAVCVM